MGVIFRAHLVRGESHIQRNANREVATVTTMQFLRNNAIVLLFLTVVRTTHSQPCSD